MLSQAKTLQGYTPNSLDGELGKVKEFYIDDLCWTIRYLVVNTANWLMGWQVLVSPYAVAVLKEEQHLAINLTKAQIEDISQQFEMHSYGHYGYPMSWGGSYRWGFYPYIQHAPEMWSESISDQEACDPHLRSTQEVTGYQIQALDGAIGYVEDFIIDDETWVIRYLIIHTRNWLRGKKRLISPQWINRVSRSESKVFVNLTCEAIQQSPEYVEDTLLTRDDETRLYQHYNCQGYWVNGAKTMPMGNNANAKMNLSQS